MPVAAALAGLALVRLPVYEKLNADSPVVVLNDEILRLATSLDWARVLLAAGLVTALAALALAAAFLPRPAAVALAALPLAVALPGGTALAFDRLFSVVGTNSLPVSLDQGVVFNWVDRELGRDARVTMLRYPVNSPDFWAGVAYWWDVEFWNESVVAADTPLRGLGAEEPWSRAFDGSSGRLLHPGTTRYLLVHGTDVRFRLAGRQVTFDRGAYIFEPEVPWRADWVTTDLYGDGWTLPHVTARIRVFPLHGQRQPLRRFLTISIAAPDTGSPRPVAIGSNDRGWEASVPSGSSIDRSVSVCVAPGEPADVTIDTPFVSDVYRDPTKGALTGEVDRPAGVLIRSIALADETEPVAVCPRR